MRLQTQGGLAHLGMAITVPLYITRPKCRGLQSSVNLDQSTGVILIGLNCDAWFSVTGRTARDEGARPW